MPYARNHIQELRAERVEIGKAMRALIDTAKKEKRDLNGEEDAKFDGLHEQNLALERKISREEKLAGIESDSTSRRSTEGIDPAADPKADKGDPDDVDTPADLADADRSARDLSKSVRNSPAYRALWRRFLAAGSSLEAQQISARGTQLRLEKRDLSQDNELQAGVLTPPEQFVQELLKEIDDAQIVRGFARKFQVPQARSLGAPKRTSKLSSWARGSEVKAPTKDTSLAFGKRNLYPQNATGEILVSRDFLRSNIMNGESIVREELARDGGEMLEREYFTGSGAEMEGLGLFVASPEGISTARDFSTGNTATEVGLDGLIEAKYGIKAAYWPYLRWIGSRKFHKQVYKIRDGQGRPIFTESYKLGEPDLVLGVPLSVSEFCPDTFTSQQYVAILGDLRYYWIADALDMEIQRLDELHARTNQVGFIGRLKTDSMPVLEECFSRVKLG
jgi:HK97 family phage major capsid protein